MREKKEGWKKEVGRRKEDSIYEKERRHKEE